MFTGLTAYDAHRLRGMAINPFLMMLRFMGHRRD
jgi:hypothetical protein